MSRKKNPGTSTSISSRAGRVLCADGYSRMLLRANIALVCGACGKAIEVGNQFTMRKISERSANNRHPVCQRCGPFGDGTHVQVRQSMAATVGRVKPIRNTVRKIS